MFQVLIGILKTNFLYGLMRPAALFQVLIGILKTLCLTNGNKMNEGFQVLIGILKTFIAYLFIFIHGIVSSPYRYSKNTV